MNKINYANGLAEMIPWNMTTVIRTHYRMKPHVMDKKVQELIKNQNPKMNLQGKNLLKDRSMNTDAPRWKKKKSNS